MTSPFAYVYRLAEILAALSMIAILLLVGGGIVFRAVGIQLAGSDDLSAYCLVGIFFLALGPTYRRCAHIRVGLLIDRMPTKAKGVLELLLTGFATIATGWATFWLGRMVYDSHRFGDVAQGLLPVPLWIPQLTMVIGAAVLLLALLEDLVRLLRGRVPSYLEISETAADDALQFER
jgi:TRAP-type C4-dicarboxylate transport system permease small subunit